jgi:hypothetical protein
MERALLWRLAIAAESPSVVARTGRNHNRGSSRDHKRREELGSRKAKPALSVTEFASAVATLAFPQAAVTLRLRQCPPQPLCLYG